MKRLTKQFMYGLGHKDCCDACSVCDVAECCDSLEEMLNKLAQFEDLEDEGMLIKLPCAVGDTVYLISYQYSECSKHQERFNECSCEGCEDECDSHKEYFIHANEDVSLEWIARAMRHNRFGNTVFHTEEAAEAKLAEMEKGGAE